ncbi:hypothetical protein D3C86_1835040 [compost metagenome]
MLPAAPGRFSTTTVHWLSTVNFSAIRREVASVPPPGGKGTISLMGLAGQLFCACTPNALPARTRAPV